MIGESAGRNGEMKETNKTGLELLPLRVEQSAHMISGRLAPSILTCFHCVWRL